MVTHGHSDYNVGQRATHLVPRAQLEGDILAYCCRSAVRSRLVPLLLAELRPCLPLRNSVVYDSLLQHSLDFARDLPHGKLLQPMSRAMPVDINYTPSLSFLHH